MPRGETSNVADGLENVVAAETVLSKVDGEAGVLILRGHRLQEIAGRRSFEWLAGLLWQDFVQRPWRKMSCVAISAPRVSACSSNFANCCRSRGGCHRWRRCACCWRACRMMRRMHRCC